MERYFEYQKKSLYDFIRNKNFGKYDNFYPEKILQLNSTTDDHNELKKLIKRLQKKINEDGDILDLLKQIEYYLPVGNNNKAMSYLLYNSKNFIEIIECLYYSKPKHILNLLNFIEKMIKSNQNISKYISNNSNFLKLILKLMQEKAYFDVCIRISEEIFINCVELIPLGEIFKELYEIYMKSVEQDKLDSFCRILAIMVFDNKKIEFKQIFKYKDYLKLHPKPKTTTQNQNICFHLPYLLMELTKILKKKNERIILFVEHMIKVNPTNISNVTNPLAIISGNNLNPLNLSNASSMNINNTYFSNDLNVNNHNASNIFMDEDLDENNNDSDEFELESEYLIDNCESNKNNTNCKDNIENNLLKEDSSICRINKNNADSNSCNNFKPNLFQNRDFNSVDKTKEKNFKKRKDKKIFVVESSIRKSKFDLIDEEIFIEKNIFEFLNEKNDIKIEKINMKENVNDKILKIRILDLMNYLRDNPIEKLEFINNNMFGELINSKINSGDPFIYITNKQYCEIFDKICLFKFSKEKYEKLSQKETRTIFENFWPGDFKNIVYSKPFEFFIPNWEDLKGKHRNQDNIYNTYVKLSKYFKLIKNKSKIGENIKQYVQILKYKSYQIEMLFVLSTLLGCKRKNEIQNNLGKLGIIQDMNKYFEYNEWGNIFDENSRPFFNNQDINYSDDSAFHGDGCKCDYDIGLKVQYLRFIYSFCCRDHDNIENKLTLLSHSDMEDMFANSYFYYFYIYLYLNKLKFNSLTKGIKFSVLAEKMLNVEKKISNLFKGFFDYLSFVELFNKTKENKIDNAWSNIINFKDRNSNDCLIYPENLLENEKDEICNYNDKDIKEEKIENSLSEHNKKKKQNHLNKVTVDKNFFYSGMKNFQKETSDKGMNTQIYKKISKEHRRIINNFYQTLLLEDVSIENINKNILNKYSNKDESCGLFIKLVLKYLSECYFSTPKFWLASCIEVMIRGNNNLFQYYITKLGLMPCLLYDIIYNKNDSLQIMQLSFDILGELIKFNRANFFLMNYYFVDNNEFSIFTKKIIAKETLIDSNVFLRSIIISTHFFDKADFQMGLDFEKNEFYTQNCKFCKFLNENIFLIFNSLIKIVKPDGINQTNISCINTALLILILNYLRGEQYMGEFLQIIREKYDDSKEGLDNFRNLIFIWREFYNYRPKDSSSLQHSTTIEFSVWQKVTTILLIQNPEREDSLFYNQTQIID